MLLRTLRVSSGRSIVLAEFPAESTAFHLHTGSSDPPGASAAAPVDASSAVSAGESSMLVAAFNGGFKREAGAGGMILDGSTVSPMLAGRATAVIDTDGSLHVGTWGVEVPTPGEEVAAARQNLQLLVDGGRPTTASHSAADAVWGATVAGGPSIARSGVGVDRAGNVFFVGSMSALPSDLAEAMVDVGVERGMQLDINPFWVTLGTASTPGAGLVGRVPGENHSPSIFTSGWQRDFVAVLAKPPLSCRLVFPAPAGVGSPNPPLTVCGTNQLALAPPGG